MQFLLDTNVVIALLKGHPGVTRGVRYHRLSDFGLSSIVVHELQFGALKSQKREESLNRIAALPFEVVSFDQDDAIRSGEVRAALEKAGSPIGLYDTLIAGQALSRDLTVVTHNVREFNRVPGLRVEDWQ